MVNAIHAHGLKCLYLGPHECRADLSVFLDNHAEAVKHAKVAITHAGIGTTVDCMGVPMVVEPVGYDQFYNANRLIDLKCAVGVKDSYIKAISEAMKPRSYLPNRFNLDQFLRLFDEHTPRNARRHAADASEHAKIH
jgi:UDP:flavonoid glycosyltransferase YjiC (YdhE family)